MRTEAETVEPISVMKLKEEVKDLNCSQLDARINEASSREIQKDEDQHCSPPDTVENSTKAEPEVATDTKDMVYHVLEGKDGSSEGEFFLESPSLANIAIEEICRTSDECKDEEKPILVKNEGDKVMQLETDTVEAKHHVPGSAEIDALGKQNSTATSLNNARTEYKELAEPSELPAEGKNVKDYMVEKLPSLPITSTLVDLSVQEGKLEGEEGEVLEERKQMTENLFNDKKNLMEKVQKDDCLVENSDVVYDEQLLEAICASQSIKKEKAVTGSQKDEVEGKSSGGDPLIESGVGQTFGETQDHSHEASLIPVSIKESLINDDRSEEATKNPEVGIDKNMEVVACNGEESIYKNTESIPIEQELGKTNLQEEGIEGKEQDTSSNLLGMEKGSESIIQTEEIENEKKEGDENQQASLRDTCISTAMISPGIQNGEADILEDEESTSNKLEIPSVTTLTEEASSLKAKPEESGTLEYASSFTLEAKEDAEKPKEEACKRHETANTNECIDKQIIQEEEAINDQSAVSSGEEVVKCSQEDEEEKHEVEVSEGLEVAGTSKDSEGQIIAEDVEDHSTAKQSNQEDIEEARKPEKEMSMGTDTNILSKEIHQKTASEDDGSIQDYCTVSDGGQEDEKKAKDPVEVFEGLQTTGTSEDTEKQTVEDGVFTNLSTESIGEQTIKESEAHERLEGAGDETTEKQITNEEFSAIDLSTKSVGEEATSRSSQEDEVFEAHETTSAAEDPGSVILPDICEDTGAVTLPDICAVAVGKVTSKEDEKNAKVQGEVKETNSTDSTQRPSTSIAAEASEEEIQKECNEQLVGHSLLVSEEHIEGKIVEKAEITSDKLETESVTMVTENTSLQEAEQEGVQLIDPSGLPSEEMTAGTTGLQVLDVEEVKLVEKSKLDENANEAILTTEKQDANEAEEDIKYDMIERACITESESEDHGIERTTGMEITASEIPNDEGTEKLFESSTTASKQPELEIAEARENIKDETLLEEKIQDEKREIPMVAQEKEENFMQKEGRCKFEETSKIESEDIGRETAVEELQKQEPVESKDAHKTAEETCTEKFEAEIAGAHENTSSFETQETSLDRYKSDKEINDEYAREDEIQDKNKIDISEIVKTRNEEVQEQSSQKDGSEVAVKEICVNVVSERVDTAVSSSVTAKHTSDNDEGAVENVEGFMEEREGGEISEINSTRETGPKIEVEDFTNLEVMQQNIKQVDSCEKIQSTDIEIPYKHHNESSASTDKSGEEIDEKNGPEEAQQVIEASEVNRSREAATSEHEASGFIQTSEMECVKLEKTDELDLKEERDYIDATEVTTNREETLDKNLNKSEREGVNTEERITDKDSAAKDIITVSLADEIAGQSCQKDEMEQQQNEEPAPEIKGEDLLHRTSDADDTTMNGIRDKEVYEGCKTGDSGESKEKQLKEEDCTVKNASAVSIGEETVEESSRAENPEEVFDGLETVNADEHIEKQIIKEDGASNNQRTVAVGEETVKESSQKDGEVAEKRETECEASSIIHLSKGLQEGGPSENTSEQIIEENDDANDNSIVYAGKEIVKHREDEEEAMKPEKEVCMELQTTSSGEAGEKNTLEATGAVKDHYTVPFEEETANDTTKEDEGEAKNPKVEVFEGLQTTGSSKDTEKIIIEDGVVADLLTASIGEESLRERSQEAEVHQRFEGSGNGEATEKQLIEGAIVPDFTTAFGGEDMIKESAQEDEVHERFQESIKSEASEKQIIEGGIYVAELQKVSMGDVTLEKSSQADEVCEGLEIAGESHEAGKHIMEEHKAGINISDVPNGEETIKENPYKEEETNKQEGEVKESNLIPEELSFEATDSAVKTRTVTLKDEEDTNKSSAAITVIEVSEEEQHIDNSEKLNETSFLLSEMSKEQVKEEILERPDKTNTKLETSSIKMETEKISLLESELDTTILVDSTDLPSGEMSPGCPANVEASATTLQALDVEDIMLGETSSITMETEKISLHESELETTNIDSTDLPSEEMSPGCPANLQASATTLQALDVEDTKLEETSSITKETEKISLHESELETADLVDSTDLPSGEMNPGCPASVTTLQALDVEDMKLEETSSIAKETEKISLHESELETTNLVDSTDLPSGEMSPGGPANLEASATTLQALDVEDMKLEFLAAEKPDAAEAEQGMKYNIMLEDASGTVPEDEQQRTEAEITAKVCSDDEREETLQESTMLTPKPQELDSIETQEKIIDQIPVENETQDEKLEIPSVAQKEEMPMQQEEEVRKVEEDTVMGSEGRENEYLNEVQNGEGETMDKSPELNPERHILEEKIVEPTQSSKYSKTGDSEPESEKGKSEGEKKFDELAEEPESTGACASYAEKDILEEGRKESMKVKDEAVELEIQDHSHETNEASNATMKGTIIENPEAVGPTKKLTDTSESDAENQSHATLIEIEKIETEEEGNIISASVEDQNVDKNFQEEDKERKNLEEAGRKLKNEDPSRKINYVNETSQGFILDAEVPREVERPEESEKIQKQIIEEEVASQEFYTVSVDDEAVEEVKDADLVSTKQTFQVIDSSEKTETESAMDEKDRNKSNVSPITKESGEELPKKEGSDMLETPSIIAKEERSSEEVEPDAEKNVVASGIGFEEKILQTVKTTETNEKDEEVKSVNLEERFESVSQLPTFEDENRNQESLTGEKLDTGKVEEGVKDELVIASDAVPQSEDPMEYANPESDTATVGSLTLTAEKIEEKVQQSSELESGEQKLETPVMEMIKDNPMIEDVPQNMENAEIETSSGQNNEANKSEAQELGVSAAIEEIKGEVPIEDETQDTKKVEVPSVAKMTEGKFSHKEEECKELKASETGSEYIEKEMQHAEHMKEENLEIAPEFIRSENDSKSTDAASILEKETEKTKKLRETTEDSEKDSLKVDKATETGLQEDEPQIQGYKKSIDRVFEEPETVGASAYPGKDVLENSDISENENPEEENSEAINLVEKIGTVESKNEKNENDSPNINALAEETLVREADGECGEATDVESEKLTKPLESVSEAQVHDMRNETKTTQNSEDGAVVKDLNTVSVGDESIGERIQEDTMGDENVSEVIPTFETKENHNEKTSEANKPLGNEFAIEEVMLTVSGSIEKGKRSENVEKKIEEEEEAVHPGQVYVRKTIKDEEDEEKGKEVEDEIKLDFEEQSHDFKAHEMQSEKTYEGNENTKKEGANQEVVFEGSAQKPDLKFVGEATVKDSHQEGQKGEKFGDGVNPSYPTIEGTGEHIKDEAPVEEILQKETEQKLYGAIVQDVVCEDENTNIQIPRQETQVFLTDERETAERSITASLDELDNASRVVLEEQSQDKTDFKSETQVNGSETKESTKIEDADNLNENIRDVSNIQPLGKELLDKEGTTKLASVAEIEKSTNTTAEEQALREVYSTESTEEEIYTGRANISPMPKDPIEKTFGKPQAEDQKPEQTLEIESEVKGVNSTESTKGETSTRSIDISPMPVDPIEKSFGKSQVEGQKPEQTSEIESDVKGVNSAENTKEEISTANTDISPRPMDPIEKTFGKSQVEDQKPEQTSEIESEVKEVECGIEESTDEPKPSDLDKVSFSDLLQKSTKETLETVGRSGDERESKVNKEALENKVAPNIQVEEEKTDEGEDKHDQEEEDEHKKDDSGSDAPVMVEASRDVDVKPAHKKSHNILSGVGSKVKHSIAKVKKAITGKSSHHKQPSPKQESESTLTVKTAVDPIL